MLAELQSACKSLVTDFNDFWVLAAVTDRSYEDGTRSRDFGESVRHYESVGLPDPQLEQLCNGINGNLKVSLERQCGQLGPVVRTKGKGQDLAFGSAEDGSSSKAEVKLTYECTYKTYYPRVAEDWHKLMRVRQAGYTGNLYLVVFAVQLPNYDYPSGNWYGRHFSPRRKFVINRGIRSQHLSLTQSLNECPAWPDEAPWVNQLTIPKDGETMDALLNWFDRVYQSDTPWRFNPAEHLKDAAVGVTIWECPKVH